MLRWVKSLSLVLAFPLLTAAAPAVDAETKQSLPCYIAMNSLAGQALAEGNKELSEHSNAAASYFLGRVDGRAPGLDLAQAMAVEFRSIANLNLGDVAKPCIEKRMRRLKEVDDASIRMHMPPR